MSDIPKPFEWTLPRLWRGVKAVVKLLGQDPMDGDDHAMFFVIFILACLVATIIVVLTLITKGWLLTIALAVVLAFDILRLIGRGMA
ncbi:hypothetical protein [Aminobacter sp. HY435]|uniref:hypothetical protein n=1 Tax=Aminobacter sp. HY435 TaxID=2970917 RepID=UPI0022B9479C|nr:hypothetical protein [Aminobacter sp. HY435]